MARTLITHPVLLKLLEAYKPLWSLGHLSGLAGWDLQTYMPEEGIEARSEALSNVATLSQSLSLRPEFIALIEKADAQKDLNEYERGIVRILKRSIYFYRVLPPPFLAEFVKVANEAHPVWEQAKKQSRFDLFEPALTKIVELARQKAKFLGYREHPYDALLDEFEEGLTTKEVERYFDEIRRPLQDLLGRILRSLTYRKEHALEEEPYEIERMHKCMQEILGLIHGNQKHLRLDVSAHPFTATIGKGDTRITTRYEGKNIASTFGSTIHEYGHALYEIQSGEDLHYTPIAGGTSLVIHESQSRFWENCVGRSKDFLQLVRPLLAVHQPSISKYSLDELHRYLNLVRPGFIRVEADEVTYHFHIMIRFEIEKALIEGAIAVKDLPVIWRKKYQEYLGITPSTDSEGVLQDVHWSGGMIGYFPTYSLGTALSAQWKVALEKELGDFSLLVSTQEGLRKIQHWLKVNIHQHGSAYTFNDLVPRVTGKPFSSTYLLDSLKEKYKAIYP